jgi:hypothetical protein
MMRYQQLRGGLDTLASAGKYLAEQQKQATLDSIQALMTISLASCLIREELKHPERFNLDGTKRVMKVRLPKGKA